MILEILQSAWQFLLISSPYILLGLVVSGFIRSFLNPTIIAKYLGANTIGSVVRAALLGVPLPLCSCGVVPTAIALRQQGASRGAVLTFLITTPESGVDSIAMTYALIDPIMAAFRPIAAFLSGIVAGTIDVLIGDHHKTVYPKHNDDCCAADTPQLRLPPRTPLRQRLKEGFYFSFVTLLNDIGLWFLAGVLIAGVINYWIPAAVVEQYLGGGMQSMVIVLVVSIPLYICAAEATPIAAALMMKGMSPGAALVLLMAGPATNIASLIVLSRFLGKGAMTIYLLTIAGMSLAMGYSLNAIYAALETTPKIASHMMQHDMSTGWHLPATIILLLAMAHAKYRGRHTTDNRPLNRRG